jgi:hypothetical protein
MLPEGEGESLFRLSWNGKRNMSSRWLRFSGGYMRYVWEYAWMTNHPRQYFSELAAGSLLGWPSFNVGVCPSSLQWFFYAITCPTDISTLEDGCCSKWLFPVMFFFLWKKSTGLGGYYYYYHYYSVLLAGAKVPLASWLLDVLVTWMALR